MAILNIAGYKFVDLEDLKDRQERYRLRGIKLNLKGFILISKEGINVCISGARSNVEEFLKLIRSEPEFSDFAVKESSSQNQPFGQFKVRLKNHIIPLSAKVRPQDGRAPVITAKELKEKLDRNDENLIILDVRNSYETKEGRFKNGQVLPIRYFRDFPEVLNKLDPKLTEELKTKEVVTVCTGGIKTEKAALWMLENGYSNVKQLDGGILKYFEEYGDSHFIGRCFVFDKRVSIDGKLAERPEPNSTHLDPYEDKGRDQEKHSHSMKWRGSNPKVAGKQYKR